eukprot:SAG31_NODE_19064_length_613_cov_0.793774_1_plen_130_part_10
MDAQQAEVEEARAALSAERAAGREQAAEMAVLEGAASELSAEVAELTAQLEQARSRQDAAKSAHEEELAIVVASVEALEEEKRTLAGHLHQADQQHAQLRQDIESLRADYGRRLRAAFAEASTAGSNDRT